MSCQHPQDQVMEGQGRTAAHFGSWRETPTPYNNVSPQSDPVEYDLLCVDHKLYSMSSIISEARKTVHACRSKIATSTEGYEQKLREWYRSYEDLKAHYEAATAKLKKDNHALNRQLEIARESIKAREWEVQRMTKEHKIALKNAEARAEIAEKKLFSLTKEKSREPDGAIAAARVLGGVVALENDKSDQIQDRRDSLNSSRRQRDQGLDDGRQISHTREFVQISPASSLKITSAPNSKKRPRSENGRDMDVQKRNRKTRKEERASEEIDEGTIVVKIGESSV